MISKLNKFNNKYYEIVIFMMNFTLLKKSNFSFQRLQNWDIQLKMLDTFYFIDLKNGLNGFKKMF